MERLAERVPSQKELLVGIPLPRQQQKLDRKALADVADLQQYKSFNAIITPEEAERIRTHEGYPKNRPVSDEHVAHLATEIEQKRLVPGQQIVFAVLDGKRFLVDGQHRIRAVERAGSAYTFDVKEIYCKTMEEVDELYWRHDQGRMRTLIDALRAASISERFGGPGKAAMLSRAATFLELNGKPYTKNKVSYDKRMEYLERWQEEGDEVLKLVGNLRQSDRTWVKRQSTMAAMLHTYAAAPDATIEFWTTTLADDGLRQGDPRKALLDFMRSTATRASSKKPIQDHMFIKAIALAWNAWRDGRKLTMLRPNFKANEVVFKGAGRMPV